MGVLEGAVKQHCLYFSWSNILTGRPVHLSAAAAAAAAAAKSLQSCLTLCDPTDRTKINYRGLNELLNMVATFMTFV